MKMFSFDHDPPVKAGCCNNEVGTTYWMAQSKNEAVEQMKVTQDDDREPHGLCATCMVEHLVSNPYEIVRGD